ncbi:hypothetical protein AKJ16_DCAP16436 [Drosera capensis]
MPLFHLQTSLGFSEYRFSLRPFQSLSIGSGLRKSDHRLRERCKRSISRDLDMIGNIMMSSSVVLNHRFSFIRESGYQTTEALEVRIGNCLNPILKRSWRHPVFPI